MRSPKVGAHLWMPPAWSMVARQYLVQPPKCLSLVVLCFRSDQVSSGSALGLILRWQMRCFHRISFIGEENCICCSLTEQSAGQQQGKQKEKLNSQSQEIAESRAAAHAANLIHK